MNKPFRKMTPERIWEMKHLRASKHLSYPRLAWLFGISRSTVMYYLVEGRKEMHLKAAKAWRDRNPDKYKDCLKRYGKTHLEQKRENLRRWRAKQKLLAA